MKTTKKLFRLTLLLLCSSCVVFIHCKQKRSTLIDSETQKAIDEEVAKFEHHCFLNELRADSFAQVVNKKYNYPYRLTAYFNTENHRRGDMLSFHNVKYYGMTDGYNAFIFSLHKMKVKEIKIHCRGMEDFWALYDWDFSDTHDIMGWEMDLNILEVTIPEHEKVIKEITERVKKDRKTNRRIVFEDLGFAIIY